MGIELDHVFLMCATGAPEGDALVRAGLREGTANTHPGQGTANRRFFFDNAYLELVWVSDAAEARGEVARPARLWERWSGRGDGRTCPFALVLRPDVTGGALPFATEPYRPPYLPPDLSIDVAVGTSLSEPAYFHLGFARARGRVADQPVDHALPVRAIQHVRIEGPLPAPPSPASRAVEAAGIASFRLASTWRMELAFASDGRRQLDFGPALPLALRY